MKVLVLASLLVLVGLCAAKTCSERRQEILDFIKEHPDLLGVHPPTCNADGTYTAKQCRESACFCVDKEGKPLKHYVEHIGKQETSCKCAREEDALKNLLGKRVVCTSNGNYHPKQCIATKCYCVDVKEGTRVGEMVDRPESDKLNC